jgi:ATP-dependent Clp protease ATP-binding subunit ClpA
VLQLEAQLADRNVVIELSDEARDWLCEHGYDEAMGARPMARLIQSTIKTPLADEVLFGKLKNGGAVRVIVNTDEAGKQALGFDYPKARSRRSPRRTSPTRRRSGSSASRGPTSRRSRRDPAERAGSGGVRTVPKVPLVRA